ncbi:MAG TPA: anhydro-N-acetylmuramic acid kinase [Rhodopila sp.]|jgi:anhydro-N-acetylmuramic acid kinase|nr:anhydro-N-acetylmuramic acid kinase [Rhodopila sp.]
MTRTIGLMSGTSLDGVDAAWIETDGQGIQGFGPTLTIPYDDALRRDLRAILGVAPELAPGDARLLDVERRLTVVHAQAVKAVGQVADVIGFHGQTILHQPDRRRTWQIGDAAMLAAETGLPVAFDFRSADVAAGGQGAPLAPAYHSALARELPKPVAVLNIGGVANVTWIGEDGAMLAFDTGPGNGPLDDWVERHIGERFDRDGALARSGRVDTAVLHYLLAHPYFGQIPPKSLDRLDFAASLAASGVNALSAEDGAATLAAFTVQAIVCSPLPAAPRRWLVCGGGRRNPILMEGLRQALGVTVDPVDTLGWDGDALEAQCFGFLAARVLAGLPLSFPGTTGVPSPMAGGRVARP